MTDQELENLQNLQKTPLHDKHIAAGAAMGEEGGWAVPMRYSGALAEATAARRHAALFDVSHLGRIRVRGDGALDLLERVCTADAARQEDDTALHTLLCNERGGILDECYLIRLTNFWVLTCNAGNREKLLEHLAAQNIPNARIDDQTTKVGQLAVVGPAAKEILTRVLPISIEGLAPGEAKMGSLMIANYIATRTSYAHGWGLEVMVPTMFLARAWEYVTAKGGENALAPAGMAARDLLRIEAGRCRYGHEIHEAIDPITAGLGGGVSFDHDFIGAEPLQKLSERGPSRKRVFLVPTVQEETTPSGKPEPGCESNSTQTSLPVMGTLVFGEGDREIGAITSATFSVQREGRLAMAYLAADAAEAGTKVRVENAGTWRVETVFS